MSRKTAWFIACGMAALAAGPASTASMIYEITTDTYLDSASPTYNYGARNVDRVVINASSAARTLFKLPAEVWSYAPIQIVSAVVSFYVWSDNAQTYDVSLHPMLRDFAEGTGTGSATGDGATWNTYDGVNAWTTAGGDFDSGYSVLGVKGTLGVNPGEPNGRFYTWDITALLNDVTAWSELQSYGAMLRIDETVPPSGQRFNAYTSSDSTTYTAPYLPSLTITAIPEPGTLALLAMGLPVGAMLLRRRKQGILSC
ncbi:MAG TPA: DNRLRE domain-containing protein [Kiritimatiellia bacterium]|nr:DNRLRE domain-containing protein [Kiritimatiellia bacterium]HRZ13513.1 DNRLRE domain-containing protein [Kiritimatiellia bacterium]HSA19182.1 DNRLRE domain-containing protein [Kiritimatiellia bacterium]